MNDYIKNKNILCVDDDEAILMSYQQILTPEEDAASEILSLAAQLTPGSLGAETSSRSPSYKLYLASSGEEAIRIVSEELPKGNRIAACFVDMRMPGGLDGYETLRRLREIDSDILCAVVTAYSDRSLGQMRDLFPASNQDELLFFRKPFNMEELEQAALNLVSGWNRKRKMEEHTRYVQTSKECFKQILNIVGILSRTPPHSLTYLLSEILHQVLKLLGSESGYIGIYDENGKYLASHCTGNFSEKEVVSVLEAKDHVKEIIAKDQILFEPNSCYIPLVCAKFNLGVIYFKAGRLDQHDLIKEVFDLFRYQITQLLLNSLYYDEIMEKTEEALTDSLTGLHNRRFLVESLKKELLKAARFNTPVSILLIDIDKFKEVNDTYGHAAGDQVLATIGKLINEMIRNYDIASHLEECPIRNAQFAIRYGGDEFTVVLVQTDGEHAKIVAERLLRQISEHQYIYQGIPFHVTVSIGIGFIELSRENTQGQDILAMLFQKADHALYQAKKLHKNTVVLIS